MPPRRRSNLKPRQSGDLDRNFRKATTSARQLSLAVSGVSGSVTGAVTAAGNLAEQFALVSKNAKLAAGATAIGAILTLGVSIKTIYDKAVQTMKDFNSEMSKLGGEIAFLEKQGKGPIADLQARKDAIRDATREEIAASQKVAKERKFTAEEQLEIEKAIFKKGREAAAALDREFDRSRGRAFDRQDEALSDEILALKGQLDPSRRSPMAKFRGETEQAIQARRRQALLELNRNDDGLNDDQIKELRAKIEKRFDIESDVLKRNLAEMAGEVGQTFALSLADSLVLGLETAFQKGANIGNAFAAFGGAAIQAMGAMFEEIGTQALLGATLLARLQKFLFTHPVTAIPAALGLIALGGAMRGLGGRMMSNSPISSGGYGGPYASTGGGGTIIDRGLINPLNPAPNTAGLRALPSITNNWTVIGTNDPVAQRDIMSLMDKALSRRGG